MSPLLKSVEEVGISSLVQKRNPTSISPVDFFSLAEVVKSNFGKLVNCPPAQVAIIPAASYGMSSAIQNLPKDNGNTVLVVSDEFPSGYYTIKKWCHENGKNLEVIEAPEGLENRGEVWNSKILSHINEDTCAVVMSSIHWTDGTLFQLKEIGEKCKANQALLIVDGTQSVGAMPIDVMDFQIDALVCAGYKWLMGPYSIGMAYYSASFNEGNPLEESWMNRSNAQNFSALTQYVDNYTPGAGRYNVGEFSNFTLLPMLNEAILQILKWDPANIQAFCKGLSEPLVSFLKANGFWLEEEDYRAKHLFGILLPDSIDQQKLLQKLQERKIFVSVRGKAIRISFHLYNTEEDVQIFINTLEEFVK